MKNKAKHFLDLVMDKKKYRSYSKAVVTAINEHFERHERLAADPYLETREKEDAFLKRVIETIETGLQFASVSMPQLAQHIAPTTSSNSDNEELSAALDFADSF